MRATHNIADLNAILPRYQALRKISTQEVLQKHGGELAYRLYKRLRELMPEKGSIRAERLAALKSGQGIKLRPAARAFADKHTKATAMNIATRKGASYMETTKKGNIKSGGRNWFQLAAAREIGIRESGRGFLSISSLYPKLPPLQDRSVSRMGHILSQFGITMSDTTGRAEIAWSGMSQGSQQAIRGLNKPAAKAAISNAIEDTYRNAMIYIEPRETRNLIRAIKTAIK